MKKINAILTWLLMLCFSAHFLTMSYSLLTGWYNPSICGTLARLTAGTVCLHVILSLIIIFFLHDGSRLSFYTKRNMSTVIQRATGLVILIMVHFHLKSFGFIAAGQSISTGDRVFIIVTEIIFFGANFLHIGVSFSKPLITFGLIRKEQTEKAVNRAAAVVCGAMMILTTTALTMFVVNWF